MLMRPATDMEVTAATAPFFQETRKEKLLITSERHGPGDFIIPQACNLGLDGIGLA